MGRTAGGYSCHAGFIPASKYMIYKNKDECYSLGYFEDETAGNLRFS
jgi:hypothetical protein